MKDTIQDECVLFSDAQPGRDPRYYVHHDQCVWAPIDVMFPIRSQRLEIRPRVLYMEFHIRHTRANLEALRAYGKHYVYWGPHALVMVYIVSRIPPWLSI